MDGRDANDKLAVYGYYWNGSSFVATGVTSTAVVKSKGENGKNTLGIYDMGGNASEWCFDIFFSSFRVNRGGYFSNQASELQVGLLMGIVPYSGGVGSGFRLARTK
jgi:formylglycine-generating enzyme required for sulfatase activity